MNVSFGRFVLDSDRRLLVADGSAVHLSPKAFRLLEILVAASPRALSKQELSDAVWPDTTVEESNLAGLVADLRSALGDDARSSRFIRTVHGFGYAFCGEIEGHAERTRAATLVFGGEELPLYRGENILGRDPTADVQVDHSTVSRRHARICVRDDAVTVEDLGSKNGTFIAGEQITGIIPLDEGAEIVLGDARLVLRRGTSRSTVTLSRSAKS